MHTLLRATSAILRGLIAGAFLTFGLIFFAGLIAIALPAALRENPTVSTTVMGGIAIAAAILTALSVKNFWDRDD
jgi:hypothetical protein